MPPPWVFKRSLFLLLIGFLIFALASQLFGYSPSLRISSTRVPPNGRHSGTTSSSSSVAGDHLDEAAIPCPSLPGIGNITIIIKTDATSHQKLPIHFNTTLRCIQNYKIYSDFAEVVDGHEVYDALDEVDSAVVDTNPEFDYYHRLKMQGREAIRPEDHGQDSLSSALDKWKLLPIVEKVYREQPAIPWYVFMEADTYLSLHNLLVLISRLDHRKPHYAGAQMQVGDDLFALGGAGFVVSNTAMRRLVIHRRERLAECDSYTADQWTGDFILGKVLTDVRARLRWAWPNFQADPLFAMDYGADNYNKRMWCHAAVSYHHMEPGEIDATWRFEQKWRKEVRFS